MASTFNLFWKITGIMNGLRRGLDTQETDPGTITTSADIIVDTDINFAGIATTQILAISNANPGKCIIVLPTVSGVLSWEGNVAASANGAVVCSANLPVILPLGATTADAVSGLLRAQSAETNITGLWYTSTGAGKVHLFVIA